MLTISQKPIKYKITVKLKEVKVYLQLILDKNELSEMAVSVSRVCLW